MSERSSVLTRFGYEPALDGLRAISVIAVVLYHGGFTWMKGGFLGVEVFFVVSGFLITTLLIEERRRSGRIALGAFWRRRFRRLLPVLFVVLAAVTAWALAFGSDEQASQVRRDLPWALLYSANWGQIASGVPYFAPADPPLLRHLWSLAVEEQWYVIWPLVVMAFGAAITRRRLVGWLLVGWLLVGVAVAVMGLTAWWSTGGPLVSSSWSFIDGADRVNVLYLSTFTRASGLLLGAAAAFLWQPWRSAREVGGLGRAAMTWVAFGALVGLGAMFVVVDLTELATYRSWLPLTSVASLVAVLAVVHHDTGWVRSLLSAGGLVAIGKRSYGLYLWSWPVAVIFGATSGEWWPFVAATAVAVVLTEVSYRWIETPIRRGAIGRWWATRRRPTVAMGAASMAGVAALAVGVVQVQPFDRFVGDDQADFDLAAVATTDVPTTTAPTTTAPTLTAPTMTAPPTTEIAATASSASPSTTSTTTTTTTSTTLPPPAETARLAIVGDSTANALAVNRPRGIGEVFPTLSNRSRDGCGVYDSGRVVSERGFRNDFAVCEGWAGTWERAGVDHDVVLVVIGAWEVFDLEGVAVPAAAGEVERVAVGFDTPEGDEFLTSRLTAGVEGIRASGANVALLEVPCMRPIDSSGTPVPALPERGDDERVAHLNDLMRSVADDLGPNVWFVDGPDEWCDDEDVATDTSLRWDGVHVYGEGANMIFEAVAADLLQIAAID